MKSTFFGIETMRKAILAQRNVMDTIGHNVANAATVGYSRQVVTLATSTPIMYAGVGVMGTGVITASIERVRDLFIDNQLRIGNSQQGKVEIEKSVLAQIENAFLEPSSSEGINGALSAFFNSWQELSKYPDSTAARNQVVAMAQNLTDVMNHIDQTLRDIRIDLNGQLKQDVQQVNNILNSIATLTPEIAKAYTHGYMPNDLLDKRDLLLEQLAQYVNFDVIDSEYLGGIAISIGGRELLRNDTVYELTYEMAWDHPSQNTKTPYMNDVSQNDFFMLAGMSKGELAGIINARDNILTSVQSSFTELVGSIMNTVNNLHSQGMGITMQDMSQFATTTADIGNMANYAQITGTDLQYFAVGDILQIEDAHGESIIVTVTQTEVDALGNGRLYFDNIGMLMKSETDGAGGHITRSFDGAGIDSGAVVRKLNTSKNNFFVAADILSRSVTGDTHPDYFSKMTSTIKLPDNVTMNTTIGELERMFGVNITDNLVGQRLQLDDRAYTGVLTDNMTLDSVFALISKMRPVVNDGEPLEIQFDSVNRTITLSGDARDALSQLGGDNGSECNLFRILGFEGYGITGFDLPVGSNMTTTLESMGVGSGYIQIDNVVIELDAAMSLQSALDEINAALNADKSLKSYGTNVFFDAQAGRLRVVSPHMFTVSTPDSSQFPALGGSFASSNFLTVLGLQRESSSPTIALEQALESVTTSDIGARITVNADILKNVNSIATSVSYAGIPGDNNIALAIAGIRNMDLMGDSSEGRLANPTQTIDDYYNNLISDIGTKSQKAIMDSSVADNFIEYYQNKWQEVSGVSIDEEMTKLIEAQQSYAAASRVLNAFDEMLDRVINGMGLVGRA